MSVGVVYPEYYFIGTSAVVLLASVLLFAGDAIGSVHFQFELSYLCACLAVCATRQFFSSSYKSYLVLFACLLIFCRSPACLWIVLCMQGSKLLHLVGISATAIATTCMLCLVYTLPFIRTVSKYLRADQENKGGFATPRLGESRYMSVYIYDWTVYFLSCNAQYQSVLLFIFTPPGNKNTSSIQTLE